METLAQGSPDEIVLQSLEREPLLSEQGLIAASGLDKEIAREAIGQLSDAGLIRGLDEQRLLISASAYQQIASDLQLLLGEFHSSYPLRQGMPRSEARSRLLVAGAGGMRKELPQRAFNELALQASADGLGRAKKVRYGSFPIPSAIRPTSSGRLIGRCVHMPPRPSARQCYRHARSVEG